MILQAKFRQQDSVLKQSFFSLASWFLLGAILGWILETECGLVYLYLLLSSLWNSYIPSTALGDKGPSSDLDSPLWSGQYVKAARPVACLQLLTWYMTAFNERI